MMTTQMLEPLGSLLETKGYGLSKDQNSSVPEPAVGPPKALRSPSVPTEILLWSVHIKTTQILEPLGSLLETKGYGLSKDQNSWGPKPVATPYKAFQWLSAPTEILL